MKKKTPQCSCQNERRILSNKLLYRSFEDKRHPILPIKGNMMTKAVFHLRPVLRNWLSTSEYWLNRFCENDEKKMSFLNNSANFQLNFMILVQEPLKFCQIW